MTLRLFDDKSASCNKSLWNNAAYVSQKRLQLSSLPTFPSEIYERVHKLMEFQKLQLQNIAKYMSHTNEFSYDEICYWPLVRNMILFKRMLKSFGD